MEGQQGIYGEAVGVSAPVVETATALQRRSAGGGADVAIARSEHPTGRRGGSAARSCYGIISMK